MCGRFTLYKSVNDLAQIFHVEKPPELEPKYNIAPTQMVTTVLYNAEKKKRELQQLRWGLIPSWAKAPRMGVKLINARSETVTEKPAFRFAFKHRRCLIVADGFYEWQQQGSKKQPFYFRFLEEKTFGFAGLWEQWESPQADTISSCTILTTEANSLVQPIHDRMPVILKQEDYELWLDPLVQKPEILQPLLHPYPPEKMTAYPVSTLVNSPKHNNPECVKPM